MLSSTRKGTQLRPSMKARLYIHTHTHIHVCVCVCVRERERERERECRPFMMARLPSEIASSS